VAGKRSPLGSRTMGSAKKPKPSNEKGTVGRVTPKKTGLFGSATLGKKTKTAALKKGVRKTIAKKGL
jgi:hypothetical protein